MSRDKRATVVDLFEGPAHGTRLPIEPRNASLYVAGERYFRMTGVTCHPPDEPIGQGYLWDGYWKQRLGKPVSGVGQ